MPQIFALRRLLSQHFRYSSLLLPKDNDAKRAVLDMLIKDYAETLRTAARNVKDAFVADACKEMEPNLFKICTFIAGGSYGKVYKVTTDKLSTDGSMQFVAAKMLMKRTQSSRRSIREKKMLYAFKDHCLVLTCLAWKEITNKVYIYMEFAPYGDLADFLSTPDGKLRAIGEESAIYYVGQMVLGLEYIHAANIIFSDMKPDNVMLCEKGRLKFADFGMARFHKADRACTLRGTAAYFAPEVWARGLWSDAIDWWALGVTMCMMLEGTNPFDPDDEDDEEQMHALAKNPRTLNQIKKWNISAAAKSLILGLLKHDPLERLGSQRSGVDRIKNDDFFGKMDLVTLLSPDFAVPDFSAKPFEGAKTAEASKGLETASLPTEYLDTYTSDED